MSWAPRLRSVLLIVNLTVMLLPLGSITFLRLYENEIVRQKEAALYAQGAFVAAIFRTEMLEALGQTEESMVRFPDAAEGGYGLPVAARWRNPANPDFTYVPVIPSLELADTVLRPPHTPKFFMAREPSAATMRAGAQTSAVLLRAQALSIDGVRIVDTNGDVVASSYGEEGRLLVMWEEVQRALQGEYVSLVRRRSMPRSVRTPLDSLGLGSPVQVFVSIPVVHQARVLGAVVLSGTPSQITEFVYGNRGQLLLALAVLMSIVTLISVFSSLTISEPIQAIIRQTDLVARGDPRGAQPVRFAMLHEVRSLSGAIARMASMIAERSAYIQAFARSVSHEFKTPLTGITGTTEILLDHHREMPPEELERFLGNLNRDAVRLSALVKRLLDFARAEVTDPGSGTAPAASTIRAVVERYAQEGMNVACEDLGEGLTVAMAGELLESLVANLLDNVRQHCPPGTRAVVSARAAQDDSGRAWLDLTVADQGPGISEANQQKAFEPFFTTARRTGGTGLGLAIVQALVKAHGGRATLRSAAGAGTAVTLRLPLA